MDIHSVTVEIGGRPITIETGKYAKQAHGAVTIRQGDSIVLCTAVSGNTPTRFDFMPLQVEYMDRTAAYGKIPGGFFKREGRSNERETLTSRLIDRPIRPLFPKTWRYETQVIATVISYDPANETDILSIAGASAALHISDIPAKESCAGVRICLVEGAFVVNPSKEQMDVADLNLVVAGTKDAVCMVEGGGKEIAESVMMDALDLAHGEIKKICAAIDELRAKTGSKAKRSPPAATASAPEALVESVKATAVPAIRTAMAVAGKHERGDALAAAKVATVAAVTAGIEDATVAAATGTQAGELFDKLFKAEMRKKVIEQGVRIDGRACDEIRPIWCEVGLSPRAHGSAIFTRGETQAFVAAALGVEDDAQRIDFAGAVGTVRRWMLTYNFPPFCTGEATPLRGPKRREIGHGEIGRAHV